VCLFLDAFCQFPFIKSNSILAKATQRVGVDLGFRGLVFGLLVKRGGEIVALFLFDLPQTTLRTQWTIHNCIFFKSIFNAPVLHSTLKVLYMVRREDRGAIDWHRSCICHTLRWQQPDGWLQLATCNTAMPMQIGDCIKNGGNFSNYFKWQFVSQAQLLPKIQFNFFFRCYFSNFFLTIWLAFLDNTQRTVAIGNWLWLSSNFRGKSHLTKTKNRRDTFRPLYVGLFSEV